MSCSVGTRLTCIVVEITDFSEAIRTMLQLPSLLLLSPFSTPFPLLSLSSLPSYFSFHSLLSTPHPPHSQAQRAAMEALASFGGTDLSSMQVKKRDLKTELKREAEKLHKEEKEEGEGDSVETRKTR